MKLQVPEIVRESVDYTWKPHCMPVVCRLSQVLDFTGFEWIHPNTVSSALYKEKFGKRIRRKIRNLRGIFGGSTVSAGSPPLNGKPGCAGAGRGRKDGPLGGSNTVLYGSEGRSRHCPTAPKGGLATVRRLLDRHSRGSTPRSHIPRPVRPSQLERRKKGSARGSPRTTLSGNSRRGGSPGNGIPPEVSATGRFSRVMGLE